VEEEYTSKKETIIGIDTEVYGQQGKSLELLVMNFALSDLVV
jgi:hypothetical protein